MGGRFVTGGIRFRGGKSFLSLGVGRGKWIPEEMSNALCCRYVVCEYYPPGNVIGEFNTQVQSQTRGTSGAMGRRSGLGRTSWFAAAMSMVLVWMMML